MSKAINTITGFDVFQISINQTDCVRIQLLPNLIYKSLSQRGTAIWSNPVLPLRIRAHHFPSVSKRRHRDQFGVKRYVQTDCKFIALFRMFINVEDLNNCVQTETILD